MTAHRDARLHTAQSCHLPVPAQDPAIAANDAQPGGQFIEQALVIPPLSHEQCDNSQKQQSEEQGYR